MHVDSAQNANNFPFMDMMNAPISCVFGTMQGALHLLLYILLFSSTTMVHINLTPMLECKDMDQQLVGIVERTVSNYVKNGL